MRALLHIGLFALTLTSVTQVGAQEGRRGVRPTTVVVGARPVARASWPETHGRSHREAVVDARFALAEQRRDHQQLLWIEREWHEARRHRSPHAARRVERRADAWIAGEIAESRARGYDHWYAARLRELRRELNAPPRGRGHGRYRHFGLSTGQVLHELVGLSETQLRRAELRARRHVRLSFGHR